MSDAKFAGLCDLTVSFVLYRTAMDEVANAVLQVIDEPDLNVALVIVDNSVPPLNLPEFDSSRVKVIATGSNLGYGRAHNIAMNELAGRAPFHIVMNTDVRYEPGTLVEMINFMRSYPGIGLAMPKVVYPDGSIQTLCRLLPTPFDLIGRRFLRWTAWGRLRERRYEMQDWTYDKVASFPFLSGCFMMINTDVLARTGGFDKRYFLYAEDLDLSRRLYKASGALFNPAVTVIHEYRGKQGVSLKRLLTLTVNLGRYFNKWGWFIDRERAQINADTLAAIALDDVPTHRRP
jgi:GT2 family glycosyltransferase